MYLYKKGIHERMYDYIRPHGRIMQDVYVYYTDFVILFESSIQNWGNIHLFDWWIYSVSLVTRLFYPPRINGKTPCSNQYNVFSTWSHEETDNVGYNSRKFELKVFENFNPMGYQYRKVVAKSNFDSSSKYILQCNFVINLRKTKNIVGLDLY